MPELPEVEYVARQLRTEIIAREFVAVTILWPRAVEGMDPADFVAALVGRRVESVGRRAKYLLLELDDGSFLVIHRRMSGNLLLTREPADEPYVRVDMALDDGRHLLYTDPRKFGRLTVAARDEIPALFATIGPEPLDPAFTPAVLAEQLSGRQRAIKALLLDQSVIAGLGNIYADEALFRAGIHPLRTGTSLSAREVRELHAGIQAALRTGIEHGGTTFGRHRDVFNEAGQNLEHVEVYRRTGQPCLRCGHPIERIVVAQRGTHFCPRCQPAKRPRARRVPAQGTPA